MKEELTARRFADLAEISLRQGRFTFTPFLTEAEYADFYSIRNTLPNVGVTAFGGYDNAERVMLRFGDAESLGWEEPFPLCCIRISPLSVKFADDLSHRDVLGAVMHLGIERSEIGDILISEKEAFLFCTQTMAEYLCRELNTIRHTSVRCTVTEELPQSITQARKEGEIQIASERIDAVIAKIYHISRNDCLDLFRRSLVFVNSRSMESGSHLLKEGDKVSVRGYGKFRFLGIIGTTRKGNKIAKYEQYI